MSAYSNQNGATINSGSSPRASKNAHRAIFLLYIHIKTFFRTEDVSVLDLGTHLHSFGTSLHEAFLQIQAKCDSNRNRQLPIQKHLAGIYIHMCIIVIVFMFLIFCPQHHPLPNHPPIYRCP